MHRGGFIQRTPKPDAASITTILSLTTSAAADSALHTCWSFFLTVTLGKYHKHINSCQMLEGEKLYCSHACSCLESQTETTAAEKESCNTQFPAFSFAVTSCWLLVFPIVLLDKQTTLCEVTSTSSTSILPFCKVPTPVRYNASHSVLGHS